MYICTTLRTGKLIGVPMGDTAKQAIPYKQVSTDVGSSSWRASLCKVPLGRTVCKEEKKME
jgi:hypothetical protein